MPTPTYMEWLRRQDKAKRTEERKMPWWMWILLIALVAYILETM